MSKTKMMRAFLAAVLSCGIVFALASCSTTYTVSYSLGEHAADDATAPESAEYAQGTEITLPAAPAAEEGWQFTAWSDGTDTYAVGDSYTVEGNVTFTATWDEVVTEPTEYTVTYALGAHAAEDAELPASSKVEEGTQITLPAAPAAENGWQFTAWSDGTNTYEAGATYTVNANVTFTATWTALPSEPEEYNVTYALGAHAAADAELPASVKVEEGTQITLPAAPAAENGWRFTAWSDGENTYAAGSDYEVNAEVTFTAQYEAVPYTISYENLNGTTVSSATEYTVENDVTFATPTARTGYNFVEWRLEDADGQVVTSTDGMTKNITVWAVWEAKTFTVTLNYNYEDAPAEKEITVTFGTTFGAASGWEAEPARVGYDFVGWYENAEGSGAAVVGTQTVDEELTDYVLYAKWSAKTYTISYENLNGTTVSSATEYTVEKDVTFATPSARTGYNFVEWRLKNADGQVVTSTEGMTENITVWAVWEVKTFTVTLNYNYTDAPASKSITVTFGTTFGAANGWETKPERSGYVFLGWNESAEGTGKAVVGTDTVDKELTDYVLYAQWEIVGIQVTFDANGGTIGGEDTFVLNVTDATVAEGEVAAPVRDGYRFDAWYTQAEGGEKVAFPISVSGKATYYAQWIKVWTVTVDTEKTTVDNNGTYQLTKPEAQEGKTFMGWASEGNLLYSEETTITVTADVTLTTVWATHNAIATEAELLAVLADETASEICLAQNIELTTAGINVTRNLIIDLNEKTITFTTGADVAAAERIRLTAYGTSASERIALTLTNGTLDFATNNNPLIGGNASMIFTQYVDLTMTKVTVNSDAMGVYVAVGSLNLTDCTIVADGSYAVGTNASLDGQGGEKYGPVNVKIMGSTLTANGVDGAGLLFNVSGELTLTDSDVTGGRQGLILRKGTATITGGSIVSTWADAENADEYLTNWESGTAIPMAALVIGDASKGVYNGDAVLTISGTQVSVVGDPEGARYVYLAGDAADGTFARLIYACSDEQMTALHAAGKIIVANENASVEVKHGELNHHDAQSATCLEDGWKEYYQCPDCDQYFDADKQAVAWEELVIKAAGAHSYGAPVYNAETKSVEVSCTYGDDTKSATVTVGDLTLESAEFTLSETGFTLTIPQAVPAAETGKYFKGWLGGDILYYPGEKVDVAFGGTLALTAQFADLYQSVTESNVQLTKWREAAVRSFTLAEGRSITLTADLGGEMIQNQFYEGIYAQVMFGQTLSGTSDIVFRPDQWYFSGDYNPDNPHPNVTREIEGIIGTAEEFNAAKLANETKIELSKTGTTVTVVYSVGEYLVCTYTITGLTASEQTVYFPYDGANVTVSNVTVTHSLVKASQNQWPTAENPLTIGDTATGYTMGTWTSSISKGEKVTFTGTMTSAAVDNCDSIGVQIYSFGNTGWFFRGDNWVNDASSQTGDSGTIAGENWNFTKLNTCGGNWDAFREELKNCAVTVTVDWTNETQIVITMAFGQYTQTYTITASSGELAQDYVLGFGFENSQTIFTNVVRTSVKA